MCGSLKFKKEIHPTKMYSLIPKNHIEGIKNEFKKEKYHWIGWARIDGNRDGSKSFIEQWSKEEIQIVTIKNIEQFTERNRHTGEDVSFNAEDRQIAAIIDKEGQLRIITRAAKNEEKKIHNRMPVTIKNDMGRNGFIAFIKEKFNVEYE
jgi:hypothetical protein